MEELQFIGFTPTMREEIDKVWIEPSTWNDGKKAAMAFVPLLEVVMKQYEEGKNEEAAGNAFYLLERLARLHCKDADYFEPDRESHCSYYEFLLEAVCHILTLVMKDKRTEQRYSNAMVWHINTINMLYEQMFQSSFTSFEDFLYGDAKRDTFVFGFEYLLEMDKNKKTMDTMVAGDM